MFLKYQRQYLKQTKIVVSKTSSLKYTNHETLTEMKNVTDTLTDNLIKHGSNNDMDISQMYSSAIKQYI